jgi:tetratricopeptide (TPR) repeat protein
MRARIRVGTPRSLVEAVRVAEEFAKLKRRPEGVVPRFIRLEHGRALGLLGRIAQAVPLLQALRVDAKNTPIESAALDVLAEIAGASNPKIALDAAEDLLERGEATKAAVRFVTCLTLFRGRPEEPRCLTGLGTAYLRSGRWLEAIAAFTMLETIKADTAETGMFKLSALRRQKDLTRDPADIKVYQDHRARMASKGGGDFLIEEEALEFEAAGNYKAAAATWAKLASDRALYRRARAVFLQPDPAAAIDLFRRHLAKAPASPEAFRSTVYVARCLVQLGKPDEALAIAEGAESKWPNQDPKMLQWLILQRAQAKAAQGKAADAEAEVAAIERIWKKEQKGLDYLSRALAVAAEAWERAAKDDAGWERAARLWHRFFEINPPDPKKDAGRLEAIASKLVEIAPRVKDAKDLWAMARDLYAQLRATRRGDTDAIRRLEAKCFAGMGRFEDAVDVLRELTAADPGMQNGTLWEELGDAHLAWGRSLEKGSVRTERIRKAADIYSSLSAALRRGEGPHFWRVTYRRAECLWETDLESLRDFFADMARRGCATRWDGGEFKPKFEALKAKLEERLPGRK